MHKFCLGWKGVNDKHFVIGSDTLHAFKMVFERYKHYPDNTTIINPESFLRHVWEQEHINIQFEGPDLIPAVSGYRSQLYKEEVCFQNNFVKLGRGMECTPESARSFVWNHFCEVIFCWCFFKAHDCVF